MFVYMNMEILTTAVQEIDALHNIHCRIEKQGGQVDAQIHLLIGQEEFC